jgi:arylsulfatase A-like enzyme
MAAWSSGFQAGSLMPNPQLSTHVDFPEISTTPEISKIPSAREEESRLLAGFLALGAVMLLVRFMILKHPPLRLFLPVLVYQDILVLGALAWLFHVFFGLLSRPQTRKLLRRIALTVSFLLAVCTLIAGIVYDNLHAPLTYRLLLASDHLRANGASIREALSLRTTMRVGEGILLFACISAGFWRLAPRSLEYARRTFFLPASALLLVVYVVFSHLWAQRYIRYRASFANAELAFISSTLHSVNPTVKDLIPSIYFKDFLPNNDNLRLKAVDHPSAALASFGNNSLSARRPRNIVMVVMESVGARRLELYHAPYADDPQLMRLAQHGIVFDRVYASQAYTSAAMAALFCSLYPQLQWEPTTRTNPDIAVVGLATLLARHGYQTAFMHSGVLDYDDEGQFLRAHGFRQVLGRDTDQSLPADPTLFAQAIDWIRTHSKQPFFLALWTQDTHHPYIASLSHDYHVHDASLNKYLNAIHSTDTLIGNLAYTLDRMGLSDDTILIVTGDHGEAFGEHGQTVHNWTVYDEETRIPLLFVNRKLFPFGLRDTKLSRQIDVSPTLLTLLGYNQPTNWQGASLFSAHRTERAYLFSRYGDFFEGLVEGDLKYIYDFNLGRAELYDLATDPFEQRDLHDDKAYSLVTKRDFLRLEAWTEYQNDRMSQLQPKQ